MRVLINCECSGNVRNAFRARGHDAYSCDIKPAELYSPYHIMGDGLEVARSSHWDMMIAHPECTRLCRSGRRWLIERNLWDDFETAIAFYIALMEMPIEKIAIENPNMHEFALARLAAYDWPLQYVQPWWFGSPMFKSTGFRTKNLPPLVKSNPLVPPAPGTERHKRWSKIHRMGPGEDRATERSRTDPNIAIALATQWG